MHFRILSAIFLLGSSLSSLWAGDWPHWRGPTRDDRVSENSGWDGKGWNPRKVWQVNVGEGATSPLVVGDSVYTMGWRGGRDHLVCLDANSGKQLWSQSYPSPRYARHARGDQGYYAGVTSTPEYDRTTGYLYSLGTDGDLRCWDVNENGKLIWTVNLYDRYQVAVRPQVNRSGHRDYGYTSSPLVHADTLIVEVGAKAGTLIGFDKRTGKELWKSQHASPAGHNGGPVPITVEGVPCVAVHHHDGLLIARLDQGNEGKTVATYPWRTEFANNIATLAVKDDHVLLTSAYNHYKVAKLKITLQGAERIWIKEHASKVCTPIVHKGCVYWAWRTLVCLDYETGELQWEAKGFADPGSCIVTADDRLLIWSGQGVLTLAETAERSPTKYERLAEMRVLGSTHAWPHVVLADGRIYCKDRKGELVCLSLKKE